MLSPASAALDGVFGAIGEPVAVVPLTGDPFTVQTLPDGTPEERGFQAPVRRVATVFAVRVSDWAQPVRGDGVTILDVPRKVTTVQHRDALRLVWTVETEAA